MSDEQEGVIKYQLNHQLEPLPADYSITEINAWRTLMYRLQLIGQNDARYEGYGFGNISHRIGANLKQFIISGTQTGHIPVLTTDDYCLVTSANPKLNQIDATGLCKPSSEALTHASVYLQDPKIHAVIHVHCPEIWNNTHQLKLPHTLKNVAYGTPEMAVAVNQLFNQRSWQQGFIFTMLGHKDGVIAFGDDLSQAANTLIKTLYLGIKIEQSEFLAST